RKLEEAGLSKCISYCSYNGVLQKGLITVGVSFGRIGKGEVLKVKPEPELVHSIGLELIRGGEQTAALAGLEAVMSRGEVPAWDALCPSFSVKINEVPLQPG